MTVIRGEGVIVEKYECKFVKTKYNKGLKVERVWIVGLVERTEKKRILLVPVERRERSKSTEIIENMSQKEVLCKKCLLERICSNRT